MNKTYLIFDFIVNDCVYAINGQRSIYKYV